MDTRTRIETIYKHYKNRNFEAVLDEFTDDMCFQWQANPVHAHYHGRCASKAEFNTQMQRIAEEWHVDEFTCVDLIVEGDRAAAQVDLRYQHRASEQWIESRMVHIWTVQPGGASDLVEYHDTALVAAMMAQPASKPPS